MLTTQICFPAAVVILIVAQSRQHATLTVTVHLSRTAATVYVQVRLSSLSTRRNTINIKTNWITATQVSRTDPLFAQRTVHVFPISASRPVMIVSCCTSTPAKPMQLLTTPLMAGTLGQFHSWRLHT